MQCEFYTSVGSYTALTKDKLIYWCVMTMDKINNSYRGNTVDLNFCHLNFWSDREPIGFTVHFSWICLNFLSGRFEIKNVLFYFVKFTKKFSEISIFIWNEKSLVELTKFNSKYPLGWVWLSLLWTFSPLLVTEAIYWFGTRYATAGYFCCG